MGPRTRRLERKRTPRVVAGDARRRSGSCARLNASARAGANLIDRSRNGPMRQPLHVRIVRTRAVALGPEWIPLSARSRRADGCGLSAIGFFWFLPSRRLAVFGQSSAANSLVLDESAPDRLGHRVCPVNRSQFLEDHL